MTKMSQYLCWTDHAVRAASPRDAASLQPGHFQAVHHPLKLRRRPLGSRTLGKWVDETEIVKVLEGPLRPDGYLLVPIVGGSGTGKSHLVRWVYERVQGRDNWEVRYLAKNRTSIRRVIEIVIEGLEGPAIEKAREALLRAPAQSESEEILAERLLDELALITSEESVGETDITDRRAAQMAAKLRRQLPDVLRDPVVRRRLTAEGAVIPRLVGLAVRGRSDGDGLDDDAMSVVDDDLPLEFEQLGEVSKQAKTLLGQMASNLTIRSSAVKLINAALPSGVKRVFVSSQVDLIEVFREVRRELLAAGRDLVLFIEDLTVLHGVEREFLDAIVEPARSPDGNLCGLRLLFAVTEGHFDGLDTVRTRCDDAYWLGSSYGPGGVGEEEAISFLGRYLNASRHDPEDVANWWSNRQSESWMQNACHACDYQVECHETFGSSEEGYGLYPFNPAAVNRFVASLSVERFDPRVVVREMINRFLTVASSDFSRGGFPSDELVGPFDERSEPLDPMVQAGLKSRRPGDFAQVVNLMRYWSDQSGAVGDEILGAFGIRALDEFDASPRTRSVAMRKTASRGPSGQLAGQEAGVGVDDETIESRLRSPWAAIFDELNGWVGNRRGLSAAATNHLKKLVHKSVTDNLDYSALPVNLGESFNEQNRFDLRRHVFIAGSVTDQVRGDPMVSIEQDVDHAAAMQGLILLAEFPDLADYPGADRFRRQAARYLEEWTGSVMIRLEQSPGPAAIEAIAGLVVCAFVAGACERASEPLDYLSVLFSGIGPVASAHRTPEWQALTKSAEDTYRRLRPVVESFFGEARGTGGTRAVRADQVLVVIKELTGRWLKSESWLPEATDAATDRFMRSVKSASEAEWEILKLRVIGAAPFVEMGRTWSEQIERVLEVVESAHRAGRLRDHDAAQVLKTLATATGENTHTVLRAAADLVAGDPPPIERLRNVAGSMPDAVATASRFVNRADDAIRAIEDDLYERRAGLLETENLEDVTAGVFAAVGWLADAVEDFET